MMPEAPALERRSRLVSFGPFSFDAQNRLLSRDGHRDSAPPARARRPGIAAPPRRDEVVSRQELLDTVWKDAFVTDTSLAEAVSFLARRSATIRRRRATSRPFTAAATGFSRRSEQPAPFDSR